MFLDRFTEYLVVEKRYSPHTVEAYRYEVQRFLHYLQEENESVDSVTYFQIRTFFSWLMEQGYHPTSVNRCLSALRTFYNYLQREGAVNQNPLMAVKALKKPKKLPVTVQADKLSALLDQQGVFNADFSGTRDRLVLEFLFGTGMRLSELLQVRVDDVDFYRKQVRVHGKRSKQRLIPMTDTLLEVLTQYMQQREQLVTEHRDLALLIWSDRGGPAYPKLIYRIVQKYLSLLSTQSKRSPHVLRHTFATTMLDNGADLNAIKELLGHADLSATQVYTHNSAERLKKIYNQAHPRA